MRRRSAFLGVDGHDPGALLLQLVLLLLGVDGGAVVLLLRPALLPLGIDGGDLGALLL
jgi:hypothetical protein